MAKSPPKDSTKWTLMVKATPAQGQPATYETEHDTEQEARSTFGATYKALGTNHHRVEACGLIRQKARTRELSCLTE